jgi:oxygen-independent coproporphyrinogen III oxidase
MRTAKRCSEFADVLMPGIYIHIPFCKQACHYCDFHFSTSQKNKGGFLRALSKEIALRKDYLEDKGISTIYFGGGTPSLLSREEVEDIINDLGVHFKIAAGAEITLEANPDDLTREYLGELMQTSVNRLSIGIQSFFDEDLEFMNRAHNSAEAKNCVKLAQDAGFKNISIDLIYGTPTMDNEQWRKNLQTAFALDVQHISAYCLTVEPRTALSKMVESKKVPDVNDERSMEQFIMLMKEMKANKFIHYEISNFGKEGFFSKHNSNYWKGEQYLGLGPSAHSFDGVSRQWNVRNNYAYISAMEKGEPEVEREELTPAQRYNEYVMTSLRTMWGVDLDYLAKEFGQPAIDHLLCEAGPHLDVQHLVQKENKLFLSDRGKLVADRVASDLFKI